MKKLGIIAGEDSLPKEIINYCLSNNIEPFIVKISSDSDASYQQYEKVIFVNIGQPGKAIDFFKNNQVKDIVFAGKILRPKNILKIKVDVKGASLLKKIAMSKIFGDNNLLASVKNFFIAEGFKVHAAHKLVKELVLQPGILSKKKPSAMAMKNIEIGRDLIKTISKFDVGQAVIVEDGRIIAIEAAEGTDKMIERSSGLIEGVDACLIKAPKHEQINEIDLPCVGLQTFICAHQAKISIIAIKAGETLLLDNEKVLEFVDENKMVLVAI